MKIKFFENIKAITERKIPNIFLNAILIILFVKCWYAIFFVIIHNLNKDLLNINQIVVASNKIFYIHSTLITVPLFLLAYSIICKRLNKFVICFLLSICFTFPIYEILDKYVHPFLFNLHIYDFLLKPNQNILNPQYSKVLIYSILLVILCFQILNKKTRSLDRVFIFIMAVSVLVTTFLFHVVIPNGFFSFIREQTYQNVINEYYKNETNSCLKNKCITVNSDTDLKDYAWFYRQGIDYLKINPKEQSVSGLLNHFVGQHFDYTVAVLSKKNTQFILFIDENSIKPYSRLSEMWFSFLTATAHSIWIFGSIFLIFFHKYRFRNKL